MEEVYTIPENKKTDFLNGESIEAFGLFLQKGEGNEVHIGKVSIWKMANSLTVERMIEELQTMQHNLRVIAEDTIWLSEELIQKKTVYILAYDKGNCSFKICSWDGSVIIWHYPMSANLPPHGTIQILL